MGRRPLYYRCARSPTRTGPGRVRSFSDIASRSFTPRRSSNYRSSNLARSASFGVGRMTTGATIMKRTFLAAWAIGLAFAGCIPKKPATGAGGEPTTQAGEGKPLQIATDPDRPSDSDEWGIVGDPSY